MLRSLPGLSFLSQRNEAQPTEIAHVLFGRALSPADGRRNGQLQAHGFSLICYNPCRLNLVKQRFHKIDGKPQRCLVYKPSVADLLSALAITTSGPTATRERVAVRVGVAALEPVRRQRRIGEAVMIATGLCFSTEL